MRQGPASFLSEDHEANMTMLQFYAPSYITPDGALEEIEAQLEINLRASVGSVVNGYLNTSRRPDGRLYCQVMLYEFDCDGSTCGLGHEGLTFAHAPDVTRKVLDMLDALGAS